MTRERLPALILLALFVALGACEGREIVVFSPDQAGAAGNAVAGAAGEIAGVAGSAAGSVDQAGSGGNVLSGAGGGGSGGSDTVDLPCASSDDCDMSWFCQKQSCTDAAGVCLPIPTDDPKFMPVCGCDGITYWNDSLRQAARISASAPRECQSGALPCRSSAECGPFGACRQILQSVNACGMPPGMGQCWAIPNDCQSADDRPAGLPCPPPPGTPAPAPQCLTLCQALQADRPYVRLPRDWVCQ